MVTELESNHFVDTNGSLIRMTVPKYCDAGKMITWLSTQFMVVDRVPITVEEQFTEIILN